MFYRLNLDDFSLSGYRLAANSSKENKEIISRDEGVIIEIKNSKVSAIYVYFSQEVNGFNPFKGEVFFNKKRLHIDSNTTPNYIKSIFGSPMEFWNDGVEVNYTYYIKDVELEFDWSYFQNDNKNNLIFNYIAIYLNDTSV